MINEDDTICSLCEKPEPRYYCWAGKPEDRGEGECPLGYPPRWEVEPA